MHACKTRGVWRHDPQEIRCLLLSQLTSNRISTKEGTTVGETAGGVTDVEIVCRECQRSKVSIDYHNIPYISMHFRENV